MVFSQGMAWSGRLKTFGASAGWSEGSAPWNCHPAHLLVASPAAQVAILAQVIADLSGGSGFPGQDVPVNDVRSCWPSRIQP